MNAKRLLCLLLLWPLLWTFSPNTACGQAAGPTPAGAEAAHRSPSVPLDGKTDPAAAQQWKPRTPEEAIARLTRISASTKFGHCCFWAWELELAILKRDREVAQRVATVLGGLQRPDGRWGLGNPWGRADYDFKERMPEDAESWDVAEAANALLDYEGTFGDSTFRLHVRKAAAYLKTCIRHSGGKPYLPHMAECNNRLQPHSTICTALLFSRLPEFKDQAKSLHESGAAMNFLRIMPHADHVTLDPPLPGPEVSDFEKVQIGYYLHLMHDPAGLPMMNRFQKPSDLNHPRGGAYLVLAQAKLGQWNQARQFANLMRDYRPNQGYEYALRDIIDYVNALPEADKQP